jgi:DNA-binding MarR family transcriptional regulator
MINEINEMTMPPSEESLLRAIDRFWETVPPTWDRIRGRIHIAATENFGITVEQFHILRHIRKGIHSASELAEVKQISRPAISQAVETLVNRGLVTRQYSVRDRRCVELELTESGNDLLDAIFKYNRAWMLEKLAWLSEDELNSLVQGMDVLHKTFADAVE